MGDKKEMKEQKKAYRKAKRKAVRPWKGLALLTGPLAILLTIVTIVAGIFDNTMAIFIGGTFWELEDEEEEEDMPPLFERMEESHVQRAYSVEKIKELLKQAGLEFVAVYGECTKSAPKPNDGRIYFVARETYQENKYYE